MELIITLFLAGSLWLYFLFAGADFGIGIIEGLCPKSLKTQMQKSTFKTIGPVWEANHVWLILAVVILFVAFPKVYSFLSIYLHIPISLLLLSIIIRGSAFTFRHYDPIKDNSQTLYSYLFVASSIISSFFLGVIAGAIILGNFIQEPSNFIDAYILSWFHPFPILLGFFSLFLTGLIASSFLLAENPSQEFKHFYLKSARTFILLSFLIGVGILCYAKALNINLVIGAENVFVGMLLLCTALIFIFLFIKIKVLSPWLIRLLIGALIFFILLSWFSSSFPVLIDLPHGQELTIYNAIAPKPTLIGLLYALVIGLLLIFPALWYLLYVFKIKN